jgi:quinol monooxygenase YgiN
MTDTVSWNLQLSIREGCYDDFKALVEEMIESTREEAGTLAYEWFVDDDKSTCHIYERYADNAAVMVHLGNFGSKFADRFMSYLEPTGFHVYGAPSEEARNALDGLGARYLGQLGGFSR